jgi:hypothetical protein
VPLFELLQANWRIVMADNAGSDTELVRNAPVPPKKADPLLSNASRIYHVAYGAYGIYFLILFTGVLLNTSYLLQHGYMVPARLGIQGGLMLATSVAVLLRTKHAIALSRSSAALYCICALFGSTNGYIALIILICHYAFTGEEVFPTFGRKPKASAKTTSIY